MKSAYQGEPTYDNVKIMSASPFRATIKINTEPAEEHESEQESDEEEFARETQSQATCLTNYAKNRESPIKDDSEVLRKHSDEFLQ